MGVNRFCPDCAKYLQSIGSLDKPITRWVYKSSPAFRECLSCGRPETKD